tara:strand:+ start:142 stop:342 length:201 start_codon:yes stop_codon:yes gene_type:complete
MHRGVINKVVQMYDSLIKIAEENLGSTVQMDWGPWTPNEKGIETMKSRRAKIKSGKDDIDYFEYEY